MKAKNAILGLSAAALGLGGCTGNMNSTHATLSTKADTAAYYMGYMNGSQLQQMGLEGIDMEVLVAGMNAGLQKAEAPADMMQMNMYVRQYLSELQQERAKAAEERGKAFLAENAKKDGVKTTESGLQYKIEKQGEGEIPADTSVVSVHYRGTLIDGTEFDSSYKRNKPTEFPVNRVIAGWTVALKLMPVGSKWTLYIPSNLAYGPPRSRTIDRSERDLDFRGRTSGHRAPAGQKSGKITNNKKQPSKEGYPQVIPALLNS